MSRGSKSRTSSTSFDPAQLRWVHNADSWRSPAPDSPGLVTVRMQRSNGAARAVKRRGADDRVGEPEDLVVGDHDLLARQLEGAVDLDGLREASLEEGEERAVRDAVHLVERR